VEAIADNWSSPKTGWEGDASQRFVKPAELPVIEEGDYRVVFCAFVRDSLPQTHNN